MTSRIVLKDLGPDRWHRIKALLDAAFDLAPEEISQLLDQLCAGDLELRAQVEKALQASPHAKGVMSVPTAAVPQPNSRGHQAAGGVGSGDATASLEDPSFPPESLTSTRLGRYTVLGEIGRGGMGVVHIGRDETLGRTVAIKALPDRFTKDPERLSRFLREGKLLASLHHPNIATIHGVEQSPSGQRFLVLERVEGRTLASRLRQGPLAFREALDVCGQIAAALGAAHALGVIHRDVKPANIMVTPSGLVKVLDFGLAKHVTRRERSAAHSGPEPSSSSDLTEFGAVLGTPGYMSPEQVLGLPQDQSCDTFAFGCVLYQCLTGRKAFRGESVFALLQATVSHDVDLSELPADTPPGLRHVVERLLEKDPARRLADIREAEAAIATALGRPSETPPTGPAVELPGDLPVPLTRFIGRAREIDEAARLLERARLVTLTGAGGCGKTRLALEIARTVRPRYAGGAWFVDLAPIEDPERVPATVAAVLGVRESADESLTQSLVRALESNPALILLDNCEHLIGAVTCLATALLQGCPLLRILATSREWLGASGEQTLVVSPLSVPSLESAQAPEVVAKSEAVRLFVERVRTARRDFALSAENSEAMTRICRRLDGIPLAIELAAARVRDRDLQEVDILLEERLGVAPAEPNRLADRHETLESTIQWSFDQLTDRERDLFRALSVFAGGWSLESAAAVCGDDRDEFEVLDALTRLVDKSLVVIDHADRVEPRYRFLEPIRQFSVARRDAEPGSAVLRDRHLEHFLRFVERSAPSLVTGPDQSKSVAQFEADHQNLLAALRWCEQAETGAEKALRLAGATWWFWFVRGHFAVGRGALARVLAMRGAQAPTSGRALALFAAGGLAVFQGDLVAGRRLNQAALDLYRELNDRLGIARCLTHLGTVAIGERNHAEARAFYDQALVIFRELGDARRVAATLNNLGIVARHQGDFDAARPAYEESIDFARKSGDFHGLCLALVNLAWVCIRVDRSDQARLRLEEALRLLPDLQARRGGTIALEVAGELLGRLGRPEVAARLLGAARALRTAIGLPPDAEWGKTLAQVAAGLRAEMGADRFERLLAEGRGWSLEAAASEARRQLSAGELDAERSEIAQRPLGSTSCDPSGRGKSSSPKPGGNLE